MARLHAASRPTRRVAGGHAGEGRDLAGHAGVREQVRTVGEDIDVEQHVADGDRFTRTDEEAAMVPQWVPLDDAVDAALSGRLHSPTAVTGVLAAWAARATGWADLRGLDAPWPQHRAYR